MIFCERDQLNLQTELNLRLVLSLIYQVKGEFRLVSSSEGD